VFGGEFGSHLLVVPFFSVIGFSSFLMAVAGMTFSPLVCLFPARHQSTTLLFVVPNNSYPFGGRIAAAFS
jgi:hypothetical protein